MNFEALYSRVAGKLELAAAVAEIEIAIYSYFRQLQPLLAVEQWWRPRRNSAKSAVRPLATKC